MKINDSLPRPCPNGAICLLLYAQELEKYAAILHLG